MRTHLVLIPIGYCSLFYQVQSVTMLRPFSMLVNEYKHVAQSLPILCATPVSALFLRQDLRILLNTFFR